MRPIGVVECERLWIPHGLGIIYSCVNEINEYNNLLSVRPASYIWYTVQLAIELDLARENFNNFPTKVFMRRALFHTDSLVGAHMLIFHSLRL